VRLHTVAEIDEAIAEATVVADEQTDEYDPEAVKLAKRDIARWKRERVYAERIEELEQERDGLQKLGLKTFHERDEAREALRRAHGWFEMQYTHPPCDDCDDLDCIARRAVSDALGEDAE
jgi:hypothetical protein